MITPHQEKPVATAASKSDFVSYLREEFTIAGACRRLGITRKSYLMWREKDPEFARDITLAQEDIIDDLEAEAKRRAYDGVSRDIYFQDRVIGQRSEYSNVLLMFLLKGLRPEKYRERQDINQQINGEIILNFVPAYENEGDKIH
jgi:hypothetical protein